MIFIEFLQVEQQYYPKLEKKSFPMKKHLLSHNLHVTCLNALFLALPYLF